MVIYIIWNKLIFFSLSIKRIRKVEKNEKNRKPQKPPSLSSLPYSSIATVSPSSSNQRSSLFLLVINSIYHYFFVMNNTLVWKLNNIHFFCWLVCNKGYTATKKGIQWQMHFYNANEGISMVKNNGLIVIERVGGDGGCALKSRGREERDRCFTFATFLGLS